MYAAKADGKNHFRLFAPRLHEAVLDRLELKGDLAHAIERGELRLAYRPIVQVDSSRSRASRRCCAGRTRCAARSAPTSSSRSPRRRV